MLRAPHLRSAERHPCFLHLSSSPTSIVHTPNTTIAGWVESERAYHQRTTEILNHLHTQMVAERQRSEVTPSIGGLPESNLPPPAYDDIKSNGPDSNMSNVGGTATQKSMFFFAEVIHAFEAEAPGELSLVPGDYVVVRQVSPTGWSEGESKGKCGWFPTSHVERRQRAPASKVVEASSLL
ncbi:hypothetical protein L7F22_010123 [Adiantum nelumboides]|nr:hypothetical protein [Adiantum nelumboides]